MSFSLQSCFNNITALADVVNPANSQTMGYDVLNRLTSATSGTGGYGSLLWLYDANGNLLSNTAAGTTYNYSYVPQTNRIAGVTWPGNSESFTYTLTGEYQRHCAKRDVHLHRQLQQGKPARIRHQHPACDVSDL